MGQCDDATMTAYIITIPSISYAKLDLTDNACEIEGTTSRPFNYE